MQSRFTSSCKISVLPIIRDQTIRQRQRQRQREKSGSSGGYVVLAFPPKFYEPERWRRPSMFIVFKRTKVWKTMSKFRDAIFLAQLINAEEFATIYTA